MKLLIEIPPEFEQDFNDNKFEDCFQRLLYDTWDRLTHSENILNAGRYEIETLEMFIKAFKNATEVQLYKHIDSNLKVPNKLLEH